MSYFNSITQNVKVSVSNNSVANLAAAATFTGTGESTLNVAGIQVNFISDQNFTILVEQSNDNTNWDISDSYHYHGTFGGVGFTVQATSSYFRVKLTNIGTATTTFLRLSVALCPIVEALPRSLDEDFNLKTALKSMTLGELDEEAEIDQFNNLRVTTQLKSVGSTFIGSTLDANFWNTTLTGTGSVVQGNGIVTIATGATANSTAKLFSLKSARFVAGNGLMYRTICKMVAATGANTRRWGAYDANDGFFFEYDNITSTLSVVCRKGASDSNKVSSGSFNGNEGTVFILDNNAHTFEIYWNLINAWFVIDGQMIQKFTGTLLPLTETPTLPISAECNNTGGNTNNNNFTLRTVQIMRFGQLLNEPISNRITGATTTVFKRGAGKLQTVLLNSTGGTSITLYDNTAGSGTILALINTGVVTALNVDIPFSTGLTATTTGAACDITLVYE